MHFYHQYNKVVPREIIQNPYTKPTPIKIIKDVISKIDSLFAKAVDFWHPQRESNSQLPLRRGLLYPFNYAGISYIIHHSFTKSKRNLKTAFV